MGNWIWLVWLPLLVLVIRDVWASLSFSVGRKIYKNKPDPYEHIWGNEWNERLQSYEKDGPWNMPPD